MKAVIYDKKGRPDILKLTDVPEPVPGEGQVLVKIHAVSVNAADYRSVKMGIIPKGRIFGADISGTVEAAGSNAFMFKKGDEVTGDLADSGFGGFAEFAAVPQNILVRKPACISHTEAAAAPMAAVTALQALRDRGCVRQGNSVLIYGSGGGVGTFAIQLARHFGANVTAVCGSKNMETAIALGADRVMDYMKEDFAKNGRKYDIVLAINGNRSLLSYRKVLAPGGINVVVGGALTQVISSVLFGGILSSGGKKMLTLAAKANVKDLEFILELMAQGKIKPVIDRKYPLEKTAEAVKYASGCHACGKVVIEVV